MDNESIQSMGDEDFGAEVSSMTGADAKNTIDNIMAKATLDPQHPFNIPTAPGRKKFLERRGKLYEQSHADDPDLMQYNKDGQAVGETTPELKRITDEAMADKQAKVDSMITQAHKDNEALKEYGYAPSEIPDDLAPYQAAALRMTLLAQQEDYENLAPMISNELKELGQSQQQGLFETFMSADLDGVLKKDIAISILQYIHDGRQVVEESRKGQGFGGGKRTSKHITPEGAEYNFNDNRPE